MTIAVLISLPKFILGCLGLYVAGYMLGWSAKKIYGIFG